MTRCQQVNVWVGCQDPESIMLSPEGLHPRTLGHIPHADALVLAVGDDEVLTDQSQVTHVAVRYDTPVTSWLLHHHSSKVLEPHYLNGP
jgi:hypothetical protein